VDPVIVMDLLAGSFGFVTCAVLFQRYKKYRSAPALALAFCVFIYGLGNFLWAIDDMQTVEQLAFVLPAYISNYLPAYFGFVFVAQTIGKRKREMIALSTIITLIGVFGFVLFPLERSLQNGGYVYFLGPELKLILIPLVIMALSLPVLLFFYTLAMHKTGNRKEVKKGSLLSAGFLLMVLGEFILVPYLKIPLLIDQIILLAGFALVSLIFLYTER
jgi:hypothetical protein